MKQLFDNSFCCLSVVSLVFLSSADVSYDDQLHFGSGCELCSASELLLAYYSNTAVNVVHILKKLAVKMPGPSVLFVAFSPSVGCSILSNLSHAC